ncbi:MAG: MoxR-like ATPase [Gammaproteobacteria bacterium]|nr:MoxR-like ATPase [Gammaproteobacteria bacterium]
MQPKENPHCVLNPRSPLPLSVTSASQLLQRALERLNHRIIGQHKLTKRLLIALIADGHLLVEGAPGLAKTSAVKALAEVVESRFHRIQFTPDLLPGDLTGTDIYYPQTGTFHFQEGPLFHNIVLADEINRAPAKVQSALLEAMAERQVTIGRKTYPLPSLFLVMATQNPIEQEGTYPLPEAQLDRFLMYIKIGYPPLQAERAILQLAREEALKQETAASAPTEPLISQQAVFEARHAVLHCHMSEALSEYIVQLVHATRYPDYISADAKRWLRYGASPRATIALDKVARAHAFLSQRDYVTPEDIHAIAHDVLRHRILLSFEAQAEGITTDHFINELLQNVVVP